MVDPNNSKSNLNDRLSSDYLDHDFISAEVKNIMKKIAEKGHSVYIVGGCVRDWFLGYNLEEFLQKGGDFDLTTSALVEDMEKWFNQYTQILDGKKFGTIKLVINNNIYEITTFRVEASYRDGRHPDEVIFSDQLTDDLSRRDFTINAIAADLKGKISDPFKGREDLSKKIIRTVGKPYDRFTEDYLRLLRAVRFSSTLGFKLEDETLNAILQILNEFPNKFKLSVSSERLLPELQKILQISPYNGIQTLIDTTLVTQIFPFKSNFTQLEDFNILMKLLMKSSSDWLVNFAILLFHIVKMNRDTERPIGKHYIEKFLVSLATKSTDRKHIQTLVSNFNIPYNFIIGNWSNIGLKYWISNILNTYHKQGNHRNRLVDDLLAIYELQFIVFEGTDVKFNFNKEKFEEFKEKLRKFGHNFESVFSKPEAFSGNDVVDMGIKGKSIRLILEELSMKTFEENNEAQHFVKSLINDPKMMDLETIVNEFGISSDEPLFHKIQKRRRAIFQRKGK